MALDLAGAIPLSRAQGYAVAGISLSVLLPMALVIDLFLMVIMAPFIVGGWVISLRAHRKLKEERDMSHTSLNPVRQVETKRPPILDISTRQGYDIATAMRGPDSQKAHRIKSVFTGRIRCLAGTGETVGVYRTRHLTKKEAQEAAAEMRAWHIRAPGEASHFFHHVSMAAKVLGDYQLGRLAAAFADGIDLAPDRIVEWAGGK